MHEIGRFLEPAVHAGVAHVGHVVNAPQTFHDEFADGFAGNFAFVAVCDFVMIFSTRSSMTFGVIGRF